MAVPKRSRIRENRFDFLCCAAGGRFHPGPYRLETRYALAVPGDGNLRALLHLVKEEMEVVLGIEKAHRLHPDVDPRSSAERSSGTSCATGFPRRVTMYTSPCSTSRMIWDQCVRASYTPTVFMR